ncbi:MAG TPA: hypothetical protein PLI09_01945 [Candidatus Hydrogenedentes bacterium]|nr:hypothetical protein [Candidatus Hydrogenedentota bacterium]
MNKIQVMVVRRLLPKGRGVLRTLIESLVAEDVEILSRVRMEAVIERSENAIAHYPLQIFLTVKATLFMLEFFAPLMTRRWQRFTSMPLEDRVRYLEGWEYSPLDMQRNLFLLLKASTLTSLASEPGLLDFAGYSAFMRHRQERPLGEAEVPPCPKKQTN